MVGIPPTLIGQLAEGRAVLVVGRGCAPADPGWKDALERLAVGLPERDVEVVRRAAVDAALGHRAALAWLRDRLPAASAAERLRDAFPDGRAVSEVIALLALLPWHAVLIAPFEDAWDRALAAAPRPLAPLPLGEMAAGAEVPSGTWLHLLGTPSRPETLCLAPADLRRRTLPGRVAACVRRTFEQRPFVFVGFDPGDPDFRLVVDGMLGSASSDEEHFLFLRASAGAGARAAVIGVELGFTVVPFARGIEDAVRALGEAWRERSAAAASPAQAYELSASLADLHLVRGDQATWMRETRALADAAPEAARAALNERMGDAFRERLANPVQAIACYRNALAAEPGRRSALRKLTALYTAHQHWRPAAEGLVALAAMEDDAAARAEALWRAARIQRDELDAAAPAAELLARAVEAAQAAPAVSVERVPAFAALFVDAGPAHIDRAIALHHRCIAENPDRLDAYRTLAQLYRAASAHDELWCVAATLTFLRKADADLRALYESHRPAGRPALPPLGADVWSLLRHPDLDADVAARVADAAPELARALSDGAPADELPRLASGDEASPPVRVWTDVCRAFGLAAIPLLRASELSAPSRLRARADEAVALGLELSLTVAPPVAARTDECELAYALGTAAALARSEALPRALVAAQAADQLRRAFASVEPPIVCDVERWMAAVELTASRAAFILCGDLAAAARTLAAEPPGGSAVPAKLRLKDLVAFSVSEPYFTIRRKLGLARG